jgi:hypothetical protein
VNAPGQAPRTIQTHLDAANNAVVLHLDQGSPAARTSAAPVVTPMVDARPPAPVPPAEPAPPSALNEPPVSDFHPRSSGGDGWRPWAEVGLVGLTALGVGFGSFFMIRRAHFVQEGPPADPELTDQATTAATICFVTSGVALTSAFVLFFTTPSSKTQAGWVVAPTAVAGGAGAIVRTSF